MAKQEDEFDKLMAETERALAAASGKASPPAARRSEPAPTRDPGRAETTMRTSAVAGMVAAGLVAAMFAAAPFLGALSGAAGAFVATFVIVLVQKLTGGRRS